MRLRWDRIAALLVLVAVTAAWAWGLHRLGGWPVLGGTWALIIAANLIISVWVDTHA